MLCASILRSVAVPIDLDTNRGFITKSYQTYRGHAILGAPRQDRLESATSLHDGRIRAYSPEMLVLHAPMKSYRARIFLWPFTVQGLH